MKKIIMLLNILCIILMSGCQGTNLPKAKDVNVGDIIIFGKYEQDGNESNGKEDIEWLVLDKSGNKVLLMSDKGLDCMPYNSEMKEVTWETCTLRAWLNEEFLNNAFNSNEKNMIQISIVLAHQNSLLDKHDMGVSAGNDTRDKIFLLSINEEDKYLTDEENRKCIPTEYAISKGTSTYTSNTKGGASTCLWWLRTPGFDNKNATVDVSALGSGDVDSIVATALKSGGFGVNMKTFCVRPCLWLNLNS